MAQTDTAPVLKDLKGSWTVDGAHSNFGFATKHMMITTVRGSFEEADASFTIGDDLASSEARATIKTASVDTRSADRDNHLRSPDFFDSEKYPEMTFRSTAIEKVSDRDFKVTGEMTIKDTTKPLTLDVTFNDYIDKDMYGSARASFTATGKLNRKEYGLIWNQPLERGGVMVGEDIKLELELAAVQPVE